MVPSLQSIGVHSLIQQSRHRPSIGTLDRGDQFVVAALPSILPPQEAGKNAGDHGRRRQPARPYIHRASVSPHEYLPYHYCVDVSHRKALTGDVAGGRQGLRRLPRFSFDDILLSVSPKMNGETPSCYRQPESYRYA